MAMLHSFCPIGGNQELNAETRPLPELRTVNRVTQLHVDGKPFLALGGELGNSTASDLAVLDTALDKCQRMNLNTIMLPVYWDLIEPEEGKFDFTLVQGAVDAARARNLRLVLLWFGTWKNSMSCYAPSWVKRDTTRFERVKQSSGETLEIISPESTAANEADARAFAQAHAVDAGVRLRRAHSHHGAGGERDRHDSRAQGPFAEIGRGVSRRGSAGAPDTGGERGTWSRCRRTLGASRSKE